MSAPPRPVTVRPGRAEDLAAVARLEDLSFDDPWSLDALLGELRTDRLRLPLVAEQDGEVCGYLMAWKVIDQLHILNIATDPARRRQGIGSALLAAAATAAAELGMQEITLEVRAGNREAISFYKGHGFVRRGLRPGYYQDNGEDALIMTLELPAAD